MDLKIFGIEELDKFMSELSAINKKRIFNDAFRMASKPIVSAARSNLRRRRKEQSKKRELSKSLGFIPIRHRSTVFIAAKAGARKGGRFRGYHGHLVDDGTTERYRHGSSHGYTGKMTGSHFWSDAVKEKMPLAKKMMMKNLLDSVEKFVAKGLKKQAKKKNYLSM